MSKICVTGYPIHKCRVVEPLCRCICSLFTLTLCMHYHSFFQSSLFIILGLSGACGQKPTEDRRVSGSKWNTIDIQEEYFVFCLRERIIPKRHMKCLVWICLFLLRQVSFHTLYLEIAQNCQLSNVCSLQQLHININL